MAREHVEEHCVWNFRNKTNEHGVRIKGKPRNRLLTIENKLVVTRGEGSGRWVKWWGVGIKEGTCDEHWVLCINVKLLNSIPKTNINTMLTNLTSFLKIFYLFTHERHRRRDIGRGRSRLPVRIPMSDSIRGPWGHDLSQRQILNH